MKVRRVFFLILSIGLILYFQKYLLQQMDRLIYPKRYAKSVSLASELYDVEESLLFSIIRAESGFYPYAKSKKNAKGLMQLSEFTWIHACEKLSLEKDRIYEKESNIRAGTWYFSTLLNEFGNEKLAILAYNAGPTKVREWQRQNFLPGLEHEQWKIPYRETETYLLKVLNYKNKYLEIYSLDATSK